MYKPLPERSLEEKLAIATQKAEEIACQDLAFEDFATTRKLIERLTSALGQVQDQIPPVIEHARRSFNRGETHVPRQTYNLLADPLGKAYSGNVTDRGTRLGILTNSFPIALHLIKDLTFNTLPELLRPLLNETASGNRYELLTRWRKDTFGKDDSNDDNPQIKQGAEEKLHEILKLRQRKTKLARLHAIISSTALPVADEWQAQLAPLEDALAEISEDIPAFETDFTQIEKIIEIAEQLSKITHAIALLKGRDDLFANWIRSPSMDGLNGSLKQLVAPLTEIGQTMEKLVHILDLTVQLYLRQWLPPQRERTVVEVKLFGRDGTHYIVQGIQLDTRNVIALREIGTLRGHASVAAPQIYGTPAVEGGNMLALPVYCNSILTEFDPLRGVYSEIALRDIVEILDTRTL